MDNTVYKQLHESINKIVGDSKKQQHQHQHQPPPPPEAGAAGGGGGGATAAGGDFEHGYLHQCVAQLQPLPDDDSKRNSPANWTEEAFKTAFSAPAGSSSSSSSSSSAFSSRRPSPSPAQAALPDDSVFEAALASNPPPDPAVVRQMLARLDTNQAMTHMVDGGDSDVSEGSENSHDEDGEEVPDDAIFEAALANNPPPDAEVVRQMLARLDTGHFVEYMVDGNDSDLGEGSEEGEGEEEGEDSGDDSDDEKDDADDEAEEEGGEERRQLHLLPAAQPDVALPLPVFELDRSPASTPLLDHEGPALSLPLAAGLEEAKEDAQAPAAPAPVTVVVDPASDVLNATLNALEEEEPGESVQRQVEAVVNNGKDAVKNVVTTTTGLKEGEEEDRALFDLSTRAVAWSAKTTTRTELCAHLDSDGEEQGCNAVHEEEDEDENAGLFEQQDRERETLLGGRGKEYEAAATQMPLPHSPPPPSSPSPQKQSLELPDLEIDVEEEVLDAPITPPPPPCASTYKAPLTVVARVRSFLAPPPPSSSSASSLSSPLSSQRRPARLFDSPQQQQQQEQQQQAQPHLSVVNKHRLVLVNPEAFEDAHPDAVVGLVAAMNRVAIDGDMDGQEWARAFELDRAFWSADPKDAHFVNQAALYADLGAAMEHEAFVQGIDVTCFAYGASKSGKTYTLFGSDQALSQDPTLQTHLDLGLIPRLLASALAEHINVTLSLSALEISALDGLHDLLQDPKAPAAGPLRIREHPAHGPFVEHLTVTEVPTTGKLQQVLVAVAAARRRTGAAGHILLTAYIMRVSSSGAVAANTRMHFIELAGIPPTSDGPTTPSSPSKSTSSASSTSSSPRRRYNSSITIGGNNGARSTHTVQPSLTALGTILKQLGKGEDIASSSRSSALTWLTKGALTNPEGSHAYLLLCLSPAPGDYHETLNTLKFGEPLRLRERDDRRRSLQPSASVAGERDPGTPVRDGDVHDWSMVHEDFDGLMRRVSGGRKENARHVLKEIVSDPQQRLVKLQQAMSATTASAAEAAQHPLGSDDEDEGEGRDPLDDSFMDHAATPLSAPRVSAELQEMDLSGSSGKMHGRSRRDNPLLRSSGSLSLSTSSSSSSGGPHQSCDVGPLKTRAMELEIQMQSMRLDRDVALSESQMAQEELQRFKSQELTAKSQKIHELDNALTALRHEYQELERATREHETERIYLGQLLEETKASHAEELRQLEAHADRLQQEKNEWQSRNPRGGSHGSYDQLQRQLMAAEQQGRRMAQELQEAALNLDKVKLDASDAARKNMSLQDEMATLRSKLLRQQQQQSAAANVEALHQQHQQQRFELMEQLRAKDAAVSEQRREASRVAQSLHDRVLTLERLAAHADGWALRDGLRVETAALGLELRRWMEKMDRRGTNDSGIPSQYDTPYLSSPSFSRYEHHQAAFPPAFSSPPPPAAPQAAAAVVEGRLSGMNECLRQENIELKEKLRSLESRDAAKALVETVLSGINHQQQQQHGGSSSKADAAAKRSSEYEVDEEGSVCSVQHYHDSRGGGGGNRHRTDYYYCDQEDELEEDELSESHDINHQLDMEAELARARQEALRLQQQNRALLGELEDLDKLLVEAESEGISLVSNGSSSKPKSRHSSPPKRDSKPSSSRHPPAPAAAVNIEAVVKEEVGKALAGLAINTSASARRPPAAAVNTATRNQQDKSTKQFLQLLEKKRRQQQQAATPLTSTPAAKPVSPSFCGGFSAPRERETRKGKTEWVRENKVIEDWIGSLRSPGAASHQFKK